MKKLFRYFNWKTTLPFRIVFFGPLLFFSKTVVTNVNCYAIGHLSNDVECLVKLIRSNKVKFKRFIIFAGDQSSNNELVKAFENISELIILKKSFFEELLAGIANVPLIGFNVDRFMALDNVPADVYQINNENPTSIFIKPPTLDIEDIFSKVPNLARLYEKPFYCFHSRSSHFDASTNNKNYFYHKNRNTDFMSYLKIIKLLDSKGIASVRLSEKSSTESDLTNKMPLNFFDVGHVGLNFDEVKRLHLWLMMNCTAFVGCSSGITQLANLFEKPVLILNGYPASFSLPHKTNGIGVPKKVFKFTDNQNKELSISSLLSDEYCWLRDDSDLLDRNIILQNQCEDLIFDSFNEFLDRIENNDWNFNSEQLVKEIRDKNSYCCNASSGFSKAYISSMDKYLSKSSNELDSKN